MHPACGEMAFDLAWSLEWRAGSSGGIFYLGEPGLATKIKLVNNLLTSTFKEMYGLTYARGEETLDFSALYMILKESS